MKHTLPKIIPINELKNTAQISQTCKESDVPIVITKNGYGEMVLMSVELYENMLYEMQTAALVNEAIDEADSGAEPIGANDFFKSLKE